MAFYEKVVELIRLGSIWLNENVLDSDDISLFTLWYYLQYPLQKTFLDTQRNMVAKSSLLYIQ